MMYTSAERGFTLIELLMVMSILTVLGMLSVPSLLASMKRGAVNQALTDLQRVATRAQVEARRHPSPIDPATSAHYGVAIIQEPAQHCIVLLAGNDGTNGSFAEENGEEVLRVPLPATVEVLADTGSGLQRLNGRLNWFYRYGDGTPIASPPAQAAIGIGTLAQGATGGQRAPGSDYYNFALPLPAVPASPVCTALVFRSPRAREGTSISIFRNGMLSMQALTPSTLHTVTE